MSKSMFVTPLLLFFSLNPDHFMTYSLLHTAILVNSHQQPVSIFTSHNKPGLVALTSSNATLTFLYAVCKDTIIL